LGLSKKPWRAGKGTSAKLLELNHESAGSTQGTNSWEQAMSEVVEPMVHEDRLPRDESQLEPKPDWAPRYPGSGRLKGLTGQVIHPDGGEYTSS